MKAAVVSRYGSPDTIRIVELPTPEPRPDEVLIRVHSASVSTGDWRLRSGNVPAGFGLLMRLFVGLRGPRKRVLGTELSGTVEAVGAAVTRFHPGDRVFAFPDLQLGAHAEFVTVAAEGKVELVPRGLSMPEAAAICFGGATALHFLQRKAKVRPGERVLIVGASGSVGSAAVELSKHFGAHVTGVCSAENAAFVRELGADAVIDYRSTDFTRSGERYDVIMDCVGTTAFAACRHSLSPGGRHLLVVSTLWQALAAGMQSRGQSRVVAGPAMTGADALKALAELCTQGAFRPRISATFPLEKIADAHALVESGRKRANIVVTMPTAE